MDLTSLKTMKRSISNPYLEIFNGLPDSYKRIDSPIVEYGESNREESYKKTRKELCTKYSYSVPTEEAILKISEWASDEIFDWGSGSGYWAWLLSQVGSKVTCLDNKPPPYSWMPIDKSAVPHDYHQTLMIGWPERDSNSSLNVLLSYKGQKLIYIGELFRGCAIPNFFAALFQQWDLVEMINIPQWYNRTDKVYLFEPLTH